MADTEQRKAKFEPKQPIELAPPKDDVISVEHLAKCDGGSSHIAL
jgi:membrane-associated progesterone receptor component